MWTSLKWTASVAALLSANGANAAPAAACAQGASDFCYAIGVPTTTAAQTDGNMYIQLSAPTTYSWVALGQGASGMAGANMFIMYADGAGNVTVSSRQGRGNMMPVYSAGSASNLVLQEGSGIVNGRMVANILCTNCKAWNGGTLSTTSTNVPHIGAWKMGSPLNSRDPAQAISIHDSTTSFNVDMTQATIPTDSNPYTQASTTNPNNSSGGTTGGATSGISVNATPDPKIIWAHGIGMGLVFAVLYPLGSALMPLLGKWQLHAGFQVITWLGMWAFFGLGVYGAQVRNLLFNNNHTTFGTVIVVLLVVQPALGQLHHMQFVKHGSRGIFSYAHIWWGRVWLVLGVINGGLGLQLSSTPQSWVAAYAVLSVIFYLFWAAVKVYATVQAKRNGTRKASSGTAYSGEDEVPMNNFGGRQPNYGKMRS